MHNLSYDAKIKYFSVIMSFKWTNDTATSGTYYQEFSSQIPTSIEATNPKYDIIGTTELYTAMVDNNIKALYVDNANLYLRSIGGTIASDITVNMIAYKAEGR